MNKRFLTFVGTITAILILGTFYLGTRLIGWSPWAQHHQGLIWALFDLFILLQMVSPYLYRAYPQHLNRISGILWIAYMSLGIFVSLFLYTLAADIVFHLIRFFIHSLDKTTLDQVTLNIVLTLAFGSVLIGFLQVLRGPKIYNVDIPLQNLPKAFDGFRILQISDLHVGPTIGRTYTQKIVNMALDLTPDMIALTGDFVDGKVSQLKEALSPLAHLKAPQGVYFITGNHEYYWGVHEWLAVYHEMGIQTLINENVRLKNNGSEILLAGVTDYTAGKIAPGHQSNVPKALEGVPANTLKILLAHHPETYKEAAQLGVHLQLSGHTHGGQFFPWSLIVNLAHRYTKGLHRHDNLWLYVNRGTGYWGPPIRFGIPTEMTLIKLKRAE